MDLWQKARGFAEEAAKRSQEISREAARRSQELTKGAARLSQEFVTDAAKRSREIAAEASRKAEQLRAEAAKRTDQIKTLAGEIEIPNPIAQIGGQGAALLGGESGAAVAEGKKEEEDEEKDLERFGVTEELREFVKGITLSTFMDFPMEDEPQISDVPLVSNVRQDLNEWQARHAMLVLSTVKEISKFRYELCPRHMKERKFWRIYFILVSNYVERCEKKYMGEKLKLEQEKQNEKARENVAAAVTISAEVKETKSQSKTSTSASADHDLDVFLLGDLGSSDEGPDIGDDEFDDDFDKIDDKGALVSDDEDKGKAAELSGK